MSPGFVRQTCGDGIVVDGLDGLTENCDDGDQDNGDGCSDSCQNEDPSIYWCPLAGGACEILCGNGDIDTKTDPTWTETCDD